MKVLVFGATGKTGLEIVKQCLDQSFDVTAFVRDPQRLTVTHEKLKHKVGDVNDEQNVVKAIEQHDAVVCALGAGNSLKETTVRTVGTQNIIQGMKQHKVTRLIVVSAMGVGESWKTLSVINKLFFALFLKHSRKDHEAQEKAVKQSGLAWTIVRPSGLKDDPKSGYYVAKEHIKAKKAIIARADVADLIVKELIEPKLIGKAVTITKA